MCARHAVIRNAPEALIVSVDVVQKSGKTIVRQAELVELMNRICQIIPPFPRCAAAAPDEFDHHVARELAGILRAGPVGDVSVRDNPRTASPACQRYRQAPCDIDVIDHLASMDGGQNVLCYVGAEAEGAPDTRAAAIQTENQSRIFRRAAVNVRIDAKRAMIAAQQRRLRFDEREIRPPHQGAVGKYPNFVFACHCHRRQDYRCAGSVAPAEVRASREMAA